MAVAIVLILLTLGYGLLIGYYYFSWRSVPEFRHAGPIPQSRISVIVPARNEERNIAQLLDSLRSQSYPKELYDVVVVDDHSTDATAELVHRHPSVRLVQLLGPVVNAQKKRAIEAGIRASDGEFIVTTDADCSAPPSWLETIAAFREAHHSVFVAAPVRLTCDNSLLQRFQALDFMMLQGVTAGTVHRGTHSLCNGANLGYDRSAFEAVDGFTGIDRVASGDDMLLMHKIRSRYPDRVHYLKSPAAIVTSAPMNSWRDFFSQRIRWASKTFYYKEASMFLALGLVYLFNLSFLFLLIAGFFNPLYWAALAALWMTKTLIELPFVASVARFYGQTGLLKYFFLFQPIHIAYTIAAGLLGQTGSYHWKGRRVR